MEGAYKMKESFIKSVDDAFRKEFSYDQLVNPSNIEQVIENKIYVVDREQVNLEKYSLGSFLYFVNNQLLSNKFTDFTDYEKARRLLIKIEGDL